MFINGGYWLFWSYLRLCVRSLKARSINHKTAWSNMTSLDTINVELKSYRYWFSDIFNGETTESGVVLSNVLSIIEINASTCSQACVFWSARSAINLGLQINQNILYIYCFVSLVLTHFKNQWHKLIERWQTYYNK